VHQLVGPVGQSEGVAWEWFVWVDVAYVEDDRQAVVLFAERTRKGGASLLVVPALDVGDQEIKCPFAEAFERLCFVAGCYDLDADCFERRAFGDGSCVIVIQPEDLGAEESVRVTQGAAGYA